MHVNNRVVKTACYITNVSMSVVANASPLLFIIFRNTYGFTYTQLGLLVLINFCTQLLVDLIFSLFSHKFNIGLCVKLTPVLTVIGLIVYSVMPIFSNHTYLWLVIGTVIFSASSGLAEVLISPVIAQLPAKDPDREMSKLHSVYAWGVVGVVVVGALILSIKGIMWYHLTLIYTVIPLVASILFCFTALPKLPTPERTSGVVNVFKNKGVWLCVIAIFFGGASECIMAQWCSGYLQQAFQIPKLLGDLAGVALFAAMLGLGRTLYGRIGKNVSKVLFISAIGATICYLTCALVPVAVIGLIGCALCGLCVSMMWPGTLIHATERYPQGGVVIFALMAAGGDFGASVGPQLVGVVADAVIVNPTFINLANTLGLTIDQLGVKAGMLAGAIFPIIAIIIFAIIFKSTQKSNKGLIKPAK